MILALNQLVNKLANRKTAYALACAWIFYLFWSLLHTGYISDDAYESMVRGLILEKGQSVWQYWWSSNKVWVLESGRVFPLTTLYSTYLFAFIKSRLVYKCISLTVVALNVIIFGAFVKKVSRSSETALLAMLSLPLFFQIRNWHDPLLAFHFLLPTLCLTLLSSLYLFYLYLDLRLQPGETRSRARSILILSALLYLVALLTYELSYPAFGLFFLLAWHHTRRFKQSLRLCLPYILLAGGMVFVVLLLKIQWINPYLNTPYIGSALNLKYSKIWLAFKVQFWSGFPLAYFYHLETHYQEWLRFYDYLLFSVFLFPILFLLLKSTTDSKTKNLGFLSLFGFCFAVFPAFVIATSGHQAELIDAGFGFGYLPVYLQYFGMCLLFLCLLQLLASLIRPRSLRLLFLSIISFTICWIGLINLGQNRAITRGTNPVYLYPRDVLTQAFEDHFFDDLPSGALLIRDWRFPFDLSWFYSSMTGKVFDAWFAREFYPEYLSRHYLTMTGLQTIDPWLARSSCIYSQNLTDWFDGIPPDSLPSIPAGVINSDVSKENIFVVTFQYDRERGQTGKVFLGKVRTLVHSPQSKLLYQLKLDRLRVYDYSRRTSQSVDLEKHPVDFNLVFEHSNDPPATSDIPSLDEFKPQLYSVNWLDGFWNYEGSPEDNVRWAQESAELVLSNLGTKPLEIEFSMEIWSGDQTPARMIISYSGAQDVLITSPAKLTYRKRITLQPGDLRILLKSEAARYAPADLRNIHFGVTHFKIRAIE